MRHGVKISALNKAKDHRVLMLRNLATSLLIHEKIQTTPAKAKVAAPIVERLISGAQCRDKRLALEHLNRVLLDKRASRKVMDVLLARYQEQKRQSGFTRILHLAKRRVGDGAAQVSLELV